MIIRKRKLIGTLESLIDLFKRQDRKVGYWYIVFRENLELQLLF